MKSLYKDLTKEYMFLDYRRGHSQLLFRRKMDGEINHNIDLIFKSVDFLCIPTWVDGVEISIEKFNSPRTQFRITDRTGNSFFIVAGAFGVFHNKFELLKSSLGDELESDFNKCIFWSEDERGAIS